jgi:surfactin synthase thioesterase subunit
MLFRFSIIYFPRKDDLYVSRDDSMRWGRFTQSAFRLFTHEAAHVLMVEDRSFLVDTILGQLRDMPT